MLSDADYKTEGMALGLPEFHSRGRGTVQAGMGAIRTKERRARNRQTTTDERGGGAEIEMLVERLCCHSFPDEAKEVTCS